MVPRDVHILTLETEYVILHGKRHFKDVIKVRISRWTVCSVLSEWVQYNHKGPRRERGRRIKRRRCDDRCPGQGDAGPPVKEFGRLLRVGKSKESDSPLPSPEGANPG